MAVAAVKTVDGIGRAWMNENRLKILFSMPNASLHGGPAQHLPLLLNGLRPNCDVWTFEFGRKKDNETFWQKITGRLLDLARLNLAITAFRPDVIHHNSAFDRMSIIRDAPLVWLTKSRRIPLLIKVHGSHKESFDNLGIINNFLRNYVVKHTETICVLSQREKEDFLRKWPDLENRVFVVKNIIKQDFLGTGRCESETPMVLFISRFIRMKGIFDLLDAVPLVREKIPNARFIFIGSGPDSDEFDGLVAERKMNQAVEHHQHIGNKETMKYYQKAWCLVFPTYYPEGMPMVVAEAIAAGCPVITSRTRFSLSYMEEGQHCLYVEPGNPSQIAEKIINLLGDKMTRERLSNNSRELSKMFTEEEVTREFIDIYTGMVNDTKIKKKRKNKAKDV